MRIINTLILSIAAALCWTTASAQIISRNSTKPQIKVQLPSGPKSIYNADTLKVIILGDVMMHTLQIEKALQKDGTYDFSSYFQHLEHHISKADLAIANMEFTLAGKPYTGYPCFSAPDSFGEYLAKTGFDIFLCANNHIFDKGGAGAERTLEIYRQLHEKYGILHTGLRVDPSSESTPERLKNNNPLFVQKKGIRLALINFTYGTNTGSCKAFPKVNRLTNKELLKETFKEAETADFVLALPHWGPEYILKHSSSQRKGAEFMVDAGADAIVGAHPHVVQDYEKIDDIPVVYSMGNAVSNMSAPNTQVELMVTLNIIREPNGDLWLDQPDFTWLWCSRPGGYNDDYTVIPIEEFIGRRGEWKGTWDYEKMMSSWMRISGATKTSNIIK